MHRLARLDIGKKLLLAAMASATLVAGQAQSPSVRSEFEVASVKPTASADGKALLQAVQSRLIMTNLALRRLILIAYGIRDYQLAGDPSWIDSDHYDIQAKADAGATVQQMEGPMLQTLLEERFRLTLHRETRQLPVYRLVIAKGGPKLQLSKEGSCAPYSLDSPPPPSTPGEARPAFCGLHAVDGLNRALDGKGVTMAALAKTLSRSYTSALGRNVIDETGLVEAFDVHLEWASDPSTGPPEPGTAPPSRTQRVRPSSPLYRNNSG